MPTQTTARFLVFIATCCLPVQQITGAGFSSLILHISAYLSILGGRGQDGSPIIIFPEFPSFCEIGDQEFRNVLTYLTSIPR